MEKLLLLVVVALGLVSFNTEKSERNEFIVKAITDRVVESGTKIANIEIRTVKKINEQQYIEEALNNALEQLSGKGEWHAIHVTKEMREESRIAFEEKVAQAGTDKEYGFKVRLKCDFEHGYGKDKNITMTFVLNKNGDVELAYTESFPKNLFSASPIRISL